MWQQRLCRRREIKKKPSTNIINDINGYRGGGENDQSHWQQKNEATQNFGGVGTARKLVEKTLITLIISF